jgi:hypothetical protein
MRICSGDTCTVCGKAFKWSKRNWVINEMVEMELITAHASCRSKLRLLTEKKQKLKDEILNVEWEMFQLCNKEPDRKVTIINGEIMCNGTFNISN